MSYGLQVWNASGVLTLDTSHRIGRIVTTFSYSFAASLPASGATTDVAVAGMVNDGTWGASCFITSGGLYNSLDINAGAANSTTISLYIMTGFVRLQTNQTGYLKSGTVVVWRY